MKSRSITKRLAGASALTLVVGLSGGAAVASSNGPVTVATGLNNPRQLAFSPGGSLYVAESGTAGTTNCQQHPEFGNVCVGLTGSVARVNSNGTVTRVVTGLPSAGSVAADGSGDVAGPSDLVFTGRHTFGLTIGLGGSGEYRAGYGRDGRLLGTVVNVDLRGKNGLGPAFGRSRGGEKSSRVQVEKAFDVVGYEVKANPDGTDIDSNGVGLARSGSRWVVADAGGNSIVSSRRGGSTVGVLAPVPTTQPVPDPPIPAGFPADAVPTDVVKGPDGAWYVSQLVGFPFEKGSSSIWRIAPGGTPVKWATGLTNVTSLAFAPNGSLYAVELASNGLFAGPMGSLVKVTPHGSTHSTVAGGLMAPYGVAIHQGKAYVTTGSVLAGGGSVVRINL